MEILAWILKAAFLIVAVLMTFLILLQEGKGGGLAGLGGTKAAGVEGVTNPIRRATVWLAVIWFMLAITLGLLSTGGSLVNDAELFKASESTPAVESPDAATGAGDIELPVGVSPNDIHIEPGAGAVKTVDIPAEAKTGAVEATKTEAKTETEKTGEAKTEAAKTEEAKTEAPKTEAAKTESAKTEAAKTEAAKTE